MSAGLRMIVGTIIDPSYDQHSVLAETPYGRRFIVSRRALRSCYRGCVIRVEAQYTREAV